MNFAKVTMKHPKVKEPMDYGWMIKISDLLELVEFFTEKNWIPKAAFLDMVNHIRTGEHHKHPVSSAAFYFCKDLADGRPDGTGAMALVSKWEGEKMVAMAKSLPVYVNRVGGWMTTSGCTEHETLVSDVWPKDEQLPPRYVKWPGGKHWYVKIGEIDLKVDGKQKWNSREGAERAYEKWRKSTGKA